MLRGLVTASLLLWALPVAAQERDYCPARPGLGDTPCTIAPGHASLEIGLADWQRDDQSDARTDSFVAGDMLFRLGVATADEIDLGWTAWGRTTIRDRASGIASHAAGVGDVRIGWRHNLLHPDGEHGSIALLPFVTLPNGSGPLGAGTWGAGIEAPMAVPAGPVSLAFTPEIDAAPDADGRGRHFAISGVAGLGFDLAAKLNLTTELRLARDEDPAGTTSQALAGLSLAWTPRDNLQLDIGTVAGLNSDAPDIELYAGISRRF